MDDLAIHVITSPGEAVIERRRENLNDGSRPILVTLQLADRYRGPGKKFEIEQFAALNRYEWGKFGTDGLRTAVTDLVDRYSENRRNGRDRSKS